MKFQIGHIEVSKQFRGSEAESLLTNQFNSYFVKRGEILDTYTAYSKHFRPVTIGEKTPLYDAIFETIEGKTKFKEFKEIKP
jgi:hypothetical protein